MTFIGINLKQLIFLIVKNSPFLLFSIQRFPCYFSAKYNFSKRKTSAFRLLKGFKSLGHSTNCLVCSKDKRHRPRSNEINRPRPVLFCYRTWRRRDKRPRLLIPRLLLCVAESTYFQCTEQDKGNNFLFGNVFIMKYLPSYHTPCDLVLSPLVQRSTTRITQ